MVSLIATLIMPAFFVGAAFMTPDASYIIAQNSKKCKHLFVFLKKMERYTVSKYFVKDSNDKVVLQIDENRIRDRDNNILVYIENNWIKG